MNCLKCGRSVKDEGVFCENCLEIMKKHPVKQDATLHLPVRKQQEQPKKQSRRKPQLQPEEKIRQQKTQIRRLRLGVTALSVLVAVLLLWLAYDLFWQKDPGDIPGKNYTVETGET